MNGCSGKGGSSSARSLQSFIPNRDRILKNDRRALPTKWRCGVFFSSLLSLLRIRITELECDKVKINSWGILGEKTPVSWLAHEITDIVIVPLRNALACRTWGNWNWTVAWCTARLLYDCCLLFAASGIYFSLILLFLRFPPLQCTWRQAAGGIRDEIVLSERSEMVPWEWALEGLFSVAVVCKILGSRRNKTYNRYTLSALFDWFVSLFLVINQRETAHDHAIGVQWHSSSSS